MLYKNKNTIQIFITFIFILCDLAMIGPFIAPFIKSNNISIAWIGLILCTKNIARMFLDFPTAILANYFGSKFIFTISRLSRVASIAILLVSKTELSFIFSMFLYGLSMSTFYGKIDSYLLDISHTKKLIGARKILSLYSLIAQLSMFGTGMIASYLFTKVGYKTLCHYTIATSLLSLLLLPLMPKIESKPHDKRTKMHKRRIKDTAKEALKVITKYKSSIWPVIVLSAINLIIWRSNSIISISMLQIGTKPEYISIITTIHFACTSIGYFISMLLPHIRLGIINTISLCSLFGLFIMAFTGNVFALAIFLIISAILPIVQIVYEKKLSNIFNNKGEFNLVIALVNILSSFFAIITGISGGIFAQYINQKYAPYLLFLIFISLAIVSQIIFIHNANFNDKNEEL